MYMYYSVHCHMKRKWTYLSELEQGTNLCTTSDCEFCALQCSESFSVCDHIHGTKCLDIKVIYHIDRLLVVVNGQNTPRVNCHILKGSKITWYVKYYNFMVSSRILIPKLSAIIFLPQITQFLECDHCVRGFIHSSQVAYQHCTTKLNRLLIMPCSA